MSDTHSVERIDRYLRLPTWQRSGRATLESAQLRLDRQDRARVAYLVLEAIAANRPSEIQASRSVAQALLNGERTPGPFGRIVRRQEEAFPGSISVIAEELVGIALDAEKT